MEKNNLDSLVCMINWFPCFHLNAADGDVDGSIRYFGFTGWWGIGEPNRSDLDENRSDWGFVGNKDSFLLLTPAVAIKGFENIDTEWSNEARLMIESMWEEKANGQYVGTPFLR